MLVGLVAGAALGGAAHVAAPGAAWLDGVIRYGTAPIGQVFLRLLFMLVIPLIVTALSLGVAGLGDLRRLSRIGVLTLVYTVAVSSIAVLIGVTLVNWVQPGAGFDPAALATLGARAGAAPPASAPAATGIDLLVNMVPNNVVKAMAEGDMLALMVFSLLLGIGLAAAPAEAARRLEEGLQGLNDVVMRLLGFVIRMAPVAVACLLFTLTARLGYDVLAKLGAYVGVVIGALALQQFGVYSAAVAWFGGMSAEFFRGARAYADPLDRPATRPCRPRFS
jgi:DAACS family dicarboxylate/amino acid:cation (Na+ or H+) symporter